MEQGYWMRLLVCVLLLSGALCAALPAEYVQYLINAARDGELSNMETPREYAFYRITRNDQDVTHLEINFFRGQESLFPVRETTTEF